MREFPYPNDYLDSLYASHHADIETFTAHGILEIAPAGFAFVRRTNAQDIFVPAHLIGGAVSGDMVKLIAATDEAGRLEGCVEQIISRTVAPLTGVINIDDEGVANLTPRRPLGRKVVLLPCESLLNGAMCHAHAYLWPEKPGDPIHAKVIDVCVDPHLPDKAVDAINLEFGIHRHFPDDALDSARCITQEVSQNEIEERYDYRTQMFITIDGETSRDFDDAVFITPLPDGWLLCVAIADVSHYVPMNSPLDNEAFRRATSVYFPDQCTPMLPEELSNGICSLNPGVDRLAVVCEIELSSDGQILSKAFHNGVINSKHRLTYNQVDQVLAGSGSVSYDTDKMLLQMAACSESLNKIRMDRGALDFGMHGADSSSKTVSPATWSDSRRIIEEFMLITNECAASLLCVEAGLSLLRIHEEPDRVRFAEMVASVQELGINVAEEIVEPAKVLKGILSCAANRLDREIILSLALRSMKKALYSPGSGNDRSLHFSLQTCCYTHFTSPIRRYPDLVVHRHIKKIIDGEVPHIDRRELEMVADQCSMREKCASDAERAIVKRLQVRSMAGFVGEVFDGVVTGVSRKGIFITFGNPATEGVVSPNTLEMKAADYCFEANTFSVCIGDHWDEYRIGKQVSVVILAADEYKRQIDLFFV